MARCGIAIYGLDPFGEDPVRARPRARARAELLRRRGQALPGRREHRLRAALPRRARDTHIGVLPIGYGDGFRRALSDNADVLIAGSPPAAGRDRQHGQRRRRPRSRPRGARAVRRRGGPDRSRAAPSGSPPRSWPGAWTRSTTRSPAVCPRVWSAVAGRERPRRTREPRPICGRDGAWWWWRRRRRQQPVREEVGSAQEVGSAPGAPPARTGEPGEALRAARAALAGTAAWLVGGAPRDRALGRDTLDLDIVVDSCARDAARAIARAAGGRRLL